MIIYYAIFFVAFILVPLDYVNNKSWTQPIFIALSIFLIAFPAFRSVGVDNDSINYNLIFKSSEDYSFLDILTGNYWENTERGYFLLNKFVSIFSDDVSYVFIIMAITTGYLNYSFIYKNSRFPFLSILFYISFFYLYRDFTQIRYAFSCACIFWFINFYLDKNYIKSFVLLIVAIMFHNTAIILCVAIPFVIFVRNPIVFLILPVICLLGFFYNPFPLLLSIPNIPSYMLNYVDEDGGGGLVVSLLGFIIIASYFIFKRQITLNERESFIFRFFAIGVALNMLFIQSAIFQRFTYLFFQFSILIVPLILSKLLLSNARYWVVFTHFVIAVFLLYYGCKMISIDLIRPYYQ